MSEPLENLYFNWLYAKVCDTNTRSPQLHYRKLLTQLHNTEFFWTFLGDDNRAEEGCNLRREFVNTTHVEPIEDWYNQGCSVLEMLIAFSRHAGFQTDREPKEWFWIMIENLGLIGFNDANRYNESYVADTMERLIWRTYEWDGTGGLFPLQNPMVDQRTVEIWYQFSGYVLEHEFI